jgi:hypothetical protein
MQPKDKLNLSWNSIFPAELIEEHDLGTPEKRSVYFMNLWNEWEATEIDLSKYKKAFEIDGGIRYGWYIHNPAREFAKKYNIPEFWEYQIRSSSVRFKDGDMALLFRLSL